ncbi:MAG: DUF5681 domain-containing protein, partial [Alphaproteobacteria bacterium]
EGYKKPPKENRFQKGKSGNPKGRARNSEVDRDIDVLEALSAALGIKRQAVIGGRAIKLAMDEAIVKKQVQKALDGYMPAVRLVLRALPTPVITFNIIIRDEDGNKTVHAPRRESSEDDDGPAKPWGRFERLIRREVKKKIWVTVEGQRKKITVLDAIFLRLVIEAGNGNIQATRMLMTDFPDIPDRVISFTPEFGEKVLRNEDLGYPEGQSWDD